MGLYLKNLYSSFIWLLMRMSHFSLLSLRYNIHSNEEVVESLLSKIPSNGGIILLSNHTSNLDPVLIIYVLSSLKINISIWAATFVFKLPYLKYVGRYIKDHLAVVKVPVLGNNRCITNPTNIHHLFARTIDGLNQGISYLIFPSGHSKYTPLEQINGKSGVHTIIKLRPNTTVVLVRINGMWGSRFSWAAKRLTGWTTEKERWYSLLSDIYKMLIFNLIFFIPRRDVTVEFMIPNDLPRNASRVEFNRYLEKKFNEIWDDRGEILTRVSDYSWKEKYTKNQYSVKNYLFNTNPISQEIKQTVLEIVAKKARVKLHQINPSMDLARSLGLDSLEVTDILIELEKKYDLPVTHPNEVTTVDHLIAIAGRVPIKRETRTGSFRHVYQKPLPIAFLKKEWKWLSLYKKYFSFS